MCDIRDESQVGAALVQLFGNSGAAILQRLLIPPALHLQRATEGTQKGIERRVPKRTRKSIFAYTYAPRQKLFQVIVSMNDVPGALSRILEALAKRVNLISTMSSSHGGDAAWSALVEATSPSETASGLEELLNSVPDVIACSAQEGKEGLLIDDFHSGVDIGGPAPYMLMRRESFSSVLGEVLKVFGKGGEVLLFDEGRKYGILTAELFRNLLGRERAKQRMLELLDVYNSLGWCEVDVKESHDPVEYVLEARDCFECSSPQTGTRSCDFMRGHLAGAISTLQGKEFSGEETSCRLMGSDRCEFRIILRSGA
jgi:predicted hydrocarbon binding protein